MKKIGVIIGIAAGKGGVGKSTVTAALARALAKNYRVGVIDADVYGPSIAQLIPATIPPKEQGNKVLPAEGEGIKMISLAHFGESANIVRAPIANGFIEQFLHDVEWGELDYLLIDFPPGTGDVQLTLMQQAQLSGALIVTTPEDLALSDVRRAMAMFVRMEVGIIGVVENMSYMDINGERIYPFGQGGGARLAKEWDVPLLDRLPLDPTIRTGNTAPFTNLAQTLASIDFVSQLPTVSLIDEGLLVIWENERVVCSIAKLQKLCPCIGCNGEVAPDVDAHAVHTVGRYGVKINFTSGCNNGIYAYSLIKEVARG
jgi:ATP-binding protein involved in chromosome partitioning